MRITDVSVTALAYPCPVSMADAIHYMLGRNTLLVHVHTDEGIRGLGVTLNMVTVERYRVQI